MTTLTIFIQNTTENQSILLISQEKEMKGIQIRKEEVNLFADDKVLHVENTKNSNKKLLELIHEYRVAGYKINIQKNQLHFYTLAMNHWKDKVWKIPFTIALKKWNKDKFSQWGKRVIQLKNVKYWWKKWKRNKFKIHMFKN